MDEIKKWAPELAVDTIVAALAALLCYIIGLGNTWQDAAETFIVAFAVMFILGLTARKKKEE